MGCCFSSETNTEIIDESPEVRQFDFLRPEGIPMYDIPEIEINFNGWHKSSVCLWPKSDIARSKFLRIERTPSPSPTYSSSLSDDSGFDIVF